MRRNPPIISCTVKTFVELTLTLTHSCRLLTCQQTVACCRTPTCCSMVSCPGPSPAVLLLNVCLMSSSRSSEHQVAMKLICTAVKYERHNNRYHQQLLLAKCLYNNSERHWQQSQFNRNKKKKVVSFNQRRRKKTEFKTKQLTDSLELTQSYFSV